MTKKKNMIARICGLLIVLTLISCCFLGTTFARYTSGVDGTASVQVAKWDIDFNGGAASATNTLEVEFGKLSPAMDEWTDVSTIRTHVIDQDDAAMSIENNGDVGAKVTISLVGDITFYNNAETPSEFTGWGEELALDENGYVTTAPSKEEAKNTIHLQYAVTTGNTQPAETAGDWKDVSTSTEVPLAKGEGVAYIWVRAIWTSNDGWGAQKSDAMDTWLGENIGSVGAQLSIVAVQASELPA